MSTKKKLVRKTSHRSPNKSLSLRAQIAIFSILIILGGLALSSIRAKFFGDGPFVSYFAAHGGVDIIATGLEAPGTTTSQIAMVSSSDLGESKKTSANVPSAKSPTTTKANTASTDRYAAQAAAAKNTKPPEKAKDQPATTAPVVPVVAPKPVVTVGVKSCPDKNGNIIAAEQVVIGNVVGGNDTFRRCDGKSGAWVSTKASGDALVASDVTMLPQGYTNYAGIKDNNGKTKCWDGNKIYQNNDLIDGVKLCKDGQIITDAAAVVAAKDAINGNSEEAKKKADEDQIAKDKAVCDLPASKANGLVWNDKTKICDKPPAVAAPAAPAAGNGSSMLTIPPSGTQTTANTNTNNPSNPNALGYQATLPSPVRYVSPTLCNRDLPSTQECVPKDGGYYRVPIAIADVPAETTSKIKSGNKCGPEGNSSCENNDCRFFANPWGWWCYSPELKNSDYVEPAPAVTDKPSQDGGQRVTDKSKCVNGADLIPNSGGAYICRNSDGSSFDLNSAFSTPQIDSKNMPGEGCSNVWLFPDSSKCEYSCSFANKKMYQNDKYNNAIPGWYCTNSENTVPDSI